MPGSDREQHDAYILYHAGDKPPLTSTAGIDEMVDSSCLAIGYNLSPGTCRVFAIQGAFSPEIYGHNLPVDEIHDADGMNVPPSEER